MFAEERCKLTVAGSYVNMETVFRNVFSEVPFFVGSPVCIYINVYSEIERNPRYKNDTENRIVQKIYLDWEKGRRKDEEGRRWEGK